MAKFNQPRPTVKTTNKEGHIAYSMKEKDKLVTQVLTTFFGEPKFYGNNDNEIIETATLVAANDPAFVQRLAVYARREFNMRSVSHILTAILTHESAGKQYIREIVPAVAVRADDMTEILSAYLNLYGKPVPNSLKKGINDAFVRFDEYALAKYKGGQNALKMRDVLRICHPTPQDKAQSEMWKRCISGELETPLTWETELSLNGNNKETWEKLIDSGKVGYMAMLRNLRNIINATPDNIGKVYETLSDADQVRKSKQFPFRFLSAYKELENVSGATSKVFGILETAVDISVENMPKISGKTAIVVDVSGSMTDFVSAKSKMTCAEIGLLIGVMAARICEESIFLTFDTDLYHPTVSTRGGLLTQTSGIDVNGGGTNMGLPFEYLTKEKIFADRIIVLSDNQVNTGRGKPIQDLASAYQRAVNPDCWIHAIDLQGYGTQQFIGSRTNIIAGWSEKLLDFIKLAEEGIDTLTKHIETYDITKHKKIQSADDEQVM